MPAVGASRRTIHLRAACTDLGVQDAHRDHVVEAAVRLHSRLAIERAVRDLAAERAVWGVEHLELAIGRVLQADPDVTPTEDWNRVQTLAQRAIAGNVGGLRVLTPPTPVQLGPRVLRSSDRQSVYTRHRDLVMTTRSVLAAESEVISYAAHRGARAAPPDLIGSVAGQLTLSAEKAEALRFAVGDDRRVTGVVGPAGSGKTYLQSAVALLARQVGIPIVGLTVGQNAAEVLAQATRQPGGDGIRTENIAMWLHAQQHPPTGTTATDWAFAPGQWVIVDEASQASSVDLARLVALLAPVAGKLILVGDTEQINAVGPGGLFRYLTGIGATTELSEIQRFDASWEGPASLRIRAGDPTVLAEYDRRRRIIGGHREQLTDRMVHAWAADMLAGRNTLMLVDTQAEAADLAQRGRRLLVEAGTVRTDRHVQLADGSHAAVGDVVVTRRNDRRLTDGEKWVANRDRWAVTDVGPARQLTVRNLRTGRRLVLPAEYVAEHVQLGYAATVDSVQGQTVETARSLIDDAVTHARLYVMLTRGQDLNEAYVVTSEHPAEGNPPQPPKSSIAILADILRHPDADRSAVETEQRLWAELDALHHWGPVFDDLAARAHADRYVAIIRAAAGDVIADRLTDDPALPALGARLITLGEAGFDPSVVLEAAVTARELFTADDVAAVLTWRIDTAVGDVAVDPRQATAPGRTASYIARIPPAHGDLADALNQVAHLADTRIKALAEQAATNRPEWAAGLGAIPSDDAHRNRWLAQAAVVVAYRDRYRIAGCDPIGPEPSHRSITQWSAWHRARIVLGTATAAGRVTAADTAELDRLIAAQLAADEAAPPHVGDDLRTAHLARAAVAQQRTELQLDLAAADAEHGVAVPRADAHRSRWWQAGPTRRRAAAEHADARATAVRAAQRAAALRGDLTAIAVQYHQLDARVQDLEARHDHWMAWYVDALPTRYLGLAAAAERAGRVAAVVGGLQDAVRRTTDLVRAVDATRQAPHADPVPARLAQAANAARVRVGPGHGDDLAVDDLDVEFGLQS